MTKIYENHAQDARYCEKSTCPTITSRYGTGGGNVPLIVSDAEVFNHHMQDGRLTEANGVTQTITSRDGEAGSLPLVLMDQGGSEMRVMEDKVGTLRAQMKGHPPIVLHETYPLKLTNALRKNDRSDGGCGVADNGDPMFTLTTTCGQCGVAEVEKINQDAYRISSDASNVMRSSNPHTGIKAADISPTLDTVDPSPSKAQGGLAIVEKPTDNSTFCLAANTIGRKPENGGGGNGWQEGLSYTLLATDVPGVCSKHRVRKLTPVECERLQGFPDNWTRIPYRGKAEEDCPDSPRYKAIGNSWAVPVVRWIGKRIQKNMEN